MNLKEEEGVRVLQITNPEFERILITCSDTNDIPESEEEKEKSDWTKKEMDEAQPMPIIEIPAERNNKKKENENLDWTEKEMDEAQPMPLPEIPAEKDSDKKES